MKPVDRLEDTDIVLLAYSKNDDEVRFCHIGLDLADVRHAAELCITKLYELDFYLGKLKMRDYANQ